MSCNLKVQRTRGKKEEIIKIKDIIIICVFCLDLVLAFKLGRGGDVMSVPLFLFYKSCEILSFNYFYMLV